MCNILMHFFYNIFIFVNQSVINLEQKFFKKARKKGLKHPPKNITKCGILLKKRVIAVGIARLPQRKE